MMEGTSAGVSGGAVAVCSSPPHALAAPIRSMAAINSRLAGLGLTAPRSRLIVPLRMAMSAIEPRGVRPNGL
jgi:hypothetical protein